MLGISKKTLVQVEKGRGNLDRDAAIAVSVIFKDSETLELTFGGDIEDVIRSLSFANSEKKVYSNTWREDLVARYTGQKWLYYSAKYNIKSLQTFR